MNLKAAIRRSLLGLNIPNEYVCLAGNSLSDPLQVVSRIQGELVDLTHSHILLGYKPLVLGIFAPASPLSFGETIVLDFYPAMRTADDPLATLILRKINETKLGPKVLHIYEGVSGQHRFLPPFHQWMNRLNASLRKKKTGNVGLPGNLYDQVRIAYSVPRPISVYSLGNGALFNFFPTDLHGPVGEHYYVGSLRHEGLACRQVESFRKVALSNVKPEAYREVYSLGKNHMSDLKPLKSFEPLVGTGRSRNWEIPLPSATVTTRELELIDYLDAGIHRILFYRVVDQISIEPSDILAHVHAYYAIWRANHHLPSSWLVR